MSSTLAKLCVRTNGGYRTEDSFLNKFDKSGHKGVGNGINTFCVWKKLECLWFYWFKKYPRQPQSILYPTIFVQYMRWGAEDVL